MPIATNQKPSPDVKLRPYLIDKLAQTPTIIDKITFQTLSDTLEYVKIIRSDQRSCNFDES